MDIAEGTSTSPGITVFEIPIESRAFKVPTTPVCEQGWRNLIVKYKPLKVCIVSTLVYCYEVY